jgi:hypothetical protein
MYRWRWALGLMALGLLLPVGAARADRTPGTKTVQPPSTGSRIDITVPYLTTGTSTLMPGKVAPRIYASPIVDDPNAPGAKPVFNLIFYGSKMDFGDQNNGATPRPPNSLRPAK